MCHDVEQSTDLLSCLPEELKEEVVRHLDGGDVLTCGKVCQTWRTTIDQENMWRRLCTDRGWLLHKESIASNDTRSWRNLYWQNKNWREGHYECYKFTDDDISRGFLLPNFNKNFTDHTSLESDGEFLLLCRRDGVNIWNVKSVAKIHQVITNNLFKYCSQFDVKVNYSFMVYLTGNFIQIFKKDPVQRTYKQFTVLHFSPGKVDELGSPDQFPTVHEYEITLKTEMNENILSVLHDNVYTKIIFLWYLNPWKQTKAIEIRGQDVKILDIKLVDSNVFILQDKMNKFTIMGYDINTRTWTLELTPFNNLDERVDNIVPRLILNSEVLTMICPSNDDKTILKVWNFNGEVLKIAYLPKETYVQCCLINDIVIYRSSKSSITVWSSTLNQVLNEFEISGVFNYIEVCPGDLLLVTRRDSYEIWDWKKGIWLYTVTDETHLCYIRVLNKTLYATLVMDLDTKRNLFVPQIIVYYFGNNILQE